MLTGNDKKDIEYVLKKLNDKSYYEYELLASILKHTNIVGKLNLYDLCNSTENNNPSKNDILFIIEMINRGA